MTMLESRLPDFPQHPEDGFQIKEDLPDGGYVVWTYSEPYNQWTYEQFTAALSGYIYTDQVLTRAKGPTRDGEPELLTQQDVNHYLDTKEGGGGGNMPGKETLPWLQINKWGMRKNPYLGNPIYEVSWSNNPNCTYTWQYEIDGEGDGNWIDIADHPQKEELGYTAGGEFPIQLSLNGSGQADILPNALMRFRITGELNGIMSELSSGVIAAWEERMDEYDPPLYETGIAADLDPYATTDYVDQQVLAASAQVQTQADWTNQVYSSGAWLLQTEGPANPEIQRFTLANEASENTEKFAEAKYISVHALGGGDFINYKFEKIGDTIQIYGNPLTGDLKPSFGIYEIEAINEHNFPDDPEADGADFSDAFIAYTVKPLTYQGIVESNELCQIKTMPPVGAVGAGVETHVGETPPADAKVGDLWYCTKPDDLTLYVLAEAPDTWAAAAPPVSLDGVREDMQNIDNTLSEVRTTLFAVDNDVKLVAQETTKELDKKVSLYSNNVVEPDGGEWRIQGSTKTFIKVDTNAKKLGLFNLQDASEDHHAISRGWAKRNTVQLSGNNVVSSGWKVQSGGQTHLHVEGGTTRIYYLQDPTHVQHPVTLQYADAKYAKKEDIDSNPSSVVSYQKFYAGNRGNQSAMFVRCITWATTNDEEVKLNVSMETYGEPILRKIIVPDQGAQDYVVDFAMHRVGRMQNGHNDWQLIMAGKTKSIRFLTYNGNKYMQVYYDISKCLVHHPEDFLKSKDDTSNDDTNYVNFQLGHILRY